MDDPRQNPGGEPPQNRLISQVERVESPEGPAYGFSLLDEETLAPCFRLAFETREDAEQGREMMKDLIEHCLWFDVPDLPPEGSSANSGWAKRWR